LVQWLHIGVSALAVAGPASNGVNRCPAVDRHVIDRDAAAGRPSRFGS
jgi:hypothetical protein